MEVSSPHANHTDTKSWSRKALTAITTCMSLASLNTSSAAIIPETYGHTKTEEMYFFDADDYGLPPKPGKVMHLSIDYQTIGKWEKGKQQSFIPSHQVNAFLSDLDYNQLIGNDQNFSSLASALTTFEKCNVLKSYSHVLHGNPLMC